jgi:hypothetical protein
VRAEEGHTGVMAALRVDLALPAGFLVMHHACASRRDAPRTVSWRAFTPAHRV